MTAVGLDPSAGAAAKTWSLTDNERAQLRNVAKQFESLFLNTLIQRMSEAQLENGFFGKSAGSSIYSGMFSQFMSDELSGRSPLGIADMLERQWAGEEDGLTQAREAISTISRMRASEAYGNAVPTTVGAGTRSQVDGTRSQVDVPDRGTRSQVDGTRSQVDVRDRISRAFGTGIHPILGDGTRSEVDVPDRISRSFGKGIHPILGGKRFHAGLDLPAPTGTPVMAVAGGRVSKVDDHTGYGLQVLVEHGNMTTRYAHLSAAKVEPGDTVRKGQQLGLVGSSGRSTGPHLHFETVIDGIAKDPLQVLGTPLAPQVFGSAADPY